MLAQITENTSSHHSLCMLNKVIATAKLHSSCQLLYQQLDLNLLRLLVYTGPAISYVFDFDSQLWYIILLTDNTGKYIIPHYAGISPNVLYDLFLALKFLHLQTDFILLLQSKKIWNQFAVLEFHSKCLPTPSHCSTY